MKHIPQEKAKAFLARLRKRKRHGEIEVFHAGRWKLLCREDLMREVCSTFEGARLSDYKPLYGIRIRKNEVAVVDAFSDG